MCITFSKHLGSSVHESVRVSPAVWEPSLAELLGKLLSCLHRVYLTETLKNCSEASSSEDHMPQASPG